MINQYELLQNLINFWGAEKRGSRYHSTCPWCYKPVMAKQTHFSFNAKGGKCFVCSKGNSLIGLVREFYDKDIKPEKIIIPPSIPKPEIIRRWMQYPEETIANLRKHPALYQEWHKYKRLMPETVDKYQLGFGVLPEMHSDPNKALCTHKRLIYPVFKAGKLIGLRGRAVECSCEKWLNSLGSQPWLWDLENVTAGMIVVICENPVDAMLFKQEKHLLDFDNRWTAVASTSGVATWRDEWTEQLVLKSPHMIMVWFDNDIAGCPNARTYDDMFRQLQEQRAEKGLPPMKPPIPNGTKITNLLLKSGLKARKYFWPPHTAWHYDLGSVIIELLDRNANGNL